MVVAVAVMSVLMIFVIPTFKEIFDGFGAELPAFTLFLIGISEFMQANWWIMLGGVMAFFYSFSYIYKRSAKLREAMDRIMLKIPVIGVILEKSAIARFARTLSTIFAAGVPLVDALQSVAGATVIFSYFLESS
ncbi:hypothetical protein TI05_19450 [Achromatium sp. WMS3]|nr:hypothetical protein TI05_19450 [Achromatium sp. WMS3]